MLTIHGRRQGPYCDGLSRRNFLKVGALGLAGPTLADLLRLRAQGAARKEAAHKAVILVYLGGGPSHIDMYDMKPNAPAEVRGEFRPIRTNMPGLDLCELMPLQAKIADRLAIVRGVGTRENLHHAHVVLSGVNRDVRRPPIGALVSRLRDGMNETLPPYVSLMPQDHPAVKGGEDPAWAGASHRPFVIQGPGLRNLTLSRDVSLERLQGRTALLRSLDHLERDLGNSRGALADADAFTARALEIVTTGKVRDAFDLAREPLRVREKYGADASQFLLARRLVEAGTSVVTLSYFGERGQTWDTHNDNFGYLRRTLPALDRAVHALVTDLAERGLDKDVAVLVCGEMGRSPKVGTPNPGSMAGSNGRDHWPQAGFALFAGGGLKMGQVVGGTNRLGERSLGLPFTMFNVLATLYHVLGIDPATTILDHSGRPQYLLDEREPIAGLV
jgi:hypothetical protein